MTAAATDLSEPALEPSAALYLPGPDPARWPASLLSLFLGYLRLEDLAACRKVCRQWYAACQWRSLPARCFLNAWQPLDRQRLLRVLAAQIVRQPRDTGSQQQTQAQDLPGPAGASCQLWYTQVQHRLQTARFSAGSLTVFHESPQGVFQSLDWSPDGQSAAAVWQDTDRAFSLHFYTWAPGAPPRHRQYFCHDRGLKSVLFGADSRSVQALDKTGTLYRWHCLPDGRWQVTGRVPVCQTAVSWALTSADARYMAVIDDGLRRLGDGGPRAGDPAVSLFARTAIGDWRGQYQWQCPQEMLDQYAGRPGLAHTQWSQDGRVFSFTAGDSALLCQRTGEAWTTQTLAGSCYPVEFAWLAPDGQALALCCIEGDEFVVSKAWLELWQPDRQGHWGALVRHECSVNWFPQASMFSPDSRQLVFPVESGEEREDTHLCVLSATRSWQLSARLPLPPFPDPAIDSLTVSDVQFNATGDRFVAKTFEAAHIWRRCGRGLDWQSAGWLTPDGPTQEPVSCVLSPDGYHCALTVMRSGHLSVWGPDAGGQYRRKLALALGAELFDIQFTPEGSGVWAAFRCLDRRRRRSRSGLVLLPLERATEEDSGQPIAGTPDALPP